MPYSSDAIQRRVNRYAMPQQPGSSQIPPPVAPDAGVQPNFAAAPALPSTSAQDYVNSMGQYNTGTVNSGGGAPVAPPVGMQAGPIPVLGKPVNNGLMDLLGAAQRRLGV